MFVLCGNRLSFPLYCRLILANNNNSNINNCDNDDSDDNNVTFGYVDISDNAEELEAFYNNLHWG